MEQGGIALIQRKNLALRKGKYIVL